MKDKLNELNKEYREKDAFILLKWAINTFKDKIILASSLGLEDQVITHMLFKINPTLDVLVLDTGRFHQETYDLLEVSMKKYNLNYKVYFPNTKKIEDFVREYGPNPFYQSITLRKKCCWIRKIEPLQRALKGYNAWITGLRCKQSITRRGIEKIEWDDNNNLFKINPLADWSADQVWNYVRKNKVPYNKLHDQGFPSIGCAPCTRPIKPGEDIRAGRWWWENPKNRECGLHIKQKSLVK
ncbi:MAG: phosphoadenylyl-sulfate reductase [Promethearchaeota archaeon]